MPANVRECLLNVGAELVYLGLVLRAQEHRSQQRGQRRGDDRRYSRKNCFSHSAVGSLLGYAYLSEPCRHLEARARFHPLLRLDHAVAVAVGREVAVADDFHLGVPGVEVADIFRHRGFLRRRARVLGLHALVAAPGVDNMAADAVVARRAVGHFPGVYHRVLVVVDEAFYPAVEPDEVGVANLLPPATARRFGRGVHTPDVGGCHVAPLGGGGAVDNEIFKRFRHSAYALAALTIAPSPSFLVGRHSVWVRMENTFSCVVGLLAASCR